MSYFAQVQNGIVRRVIAAEQDFIDSGAVGDPATWVQTFYNNNIRYRFAGIGYTYDSQRDAFIAPQPFPSWTLNEATCDWEAPMPMPKDGMYSWNEEKGEWDAVSNPMLVP